MSLWINVRFGDSCRCGLHQLSPQLLLSFQRCCGNFTWFSISTEGEEITTAPLRGPDCWIWSEWTLIIVVSKMSTNSDVENITTGRVPRNISALHSSNFPSRARNQDSESPAKMWHLAGAEWTRVDLQWTDVLGWVYIYFTCRERKAVLNMFWLWGPSALCNTHWN